MSRNERYDFRIYLGKKIFWGNPFENIGKRDNLQTENIDKMTDYTRFSPANSGTAAACRRRNHRPAKNICRSRKRSRGADIVR